MSYPQSPQLHEFWTELTTWLPVKIKESRNDDDPYEDWAGSNWAQTQIVANTSYWASRRGQAAADGPASAIRDYATDIAIDASDAMMASMVDKSKPITKLKDMEVGKMYAANMTEGMTDENGIPEAPKWAIMTITSKARKYAEIVGIKTSLENITPPGWEGPVVDYYNNIHSFLSDNNWRWMEDEQGEEFRDYVFTLAKYNKKYKALRKRGLDDDTAHSKVTAQCQRDALNDTFKNLDQIAGYPFPDLDQRGVRQWLETGVSPFSLLKVDLWVDSPNETYKKDRRVDPFNVQPGGHYYNRPPKVSTWYPVRSGGPTKKQRRKPHYTATSQVGLINWNLQDPEGF